MAKQQQAAAVAAAPQQGMTAGVTIPPRQHDIERLQSVATVKLVLSPEEVALKGIELAEADLQLAAYELEKQLWLKEWRKKRNALAGHRDILAAQTASGEEERDVPVYLDHDLTTNTVTTVRADTGNEEPVEPAREMTAKERENVMQIRQTPIPGTEDTGETEEPEGPNVRCENCQHEWSAVKPPVRVSDASIGLECPICRAVRGFEIIQAAEAAP